MTSYRLSESFDIHTILFWTVAMPLYRGALAIEGAYHTITAMLPALLFWLGILAKVLGLVAGVAGGMAVAIACPALPCGLAIVAAFAWVTYPRTAVR